VLVLEIREGGPATLPAMVESLRAVLASEAGAREQFEDALITGGYFDVHAPRYSGRGYAVRAAHWFRVRGKHPRIVEAELCAGVGDVHYALSLAACEPFAVEPGKATATLAAPPVSHKRKPRLP
jgi:hypothetical protein